MCNLFKVKRIILFLILIVFHDVITACEKVIIDISDVEEAELLIPPSDSLAVFFDSDSLKILYFNKMEDWQNMQGGAIYKDRLVCLMATDEMTGEEYNGFVYDITAVPLKT